VGLEVADRTVAEPDRLGFLEQPDRVLAPAIWAAVRTAPPRHAQHLDPAPAPRGLDLDQRHFEVLQPEIDREIIPPVLVHSSDPPPFSQEERSWMNQDVSFRQAPPISSEPLSLRKSEKSRIIGEAKSTVRPMTELTIEVT